MDYTVRGISQARILEWLAFPFSRGSSQPGDWTKVSCIAGGFFTVGATGEAQEYWSRSLFQWIFWTQESNPGLLHCRWILYQLSHQGSPLFWWSVQFSSVTQSCPTLCDPVNHSTPGLPVHHQLPESTQTHVHWVSDGFGDSSAKSQDWHPVSKVHFHRRGCVFIHLLVFMAQTVFIPISFSLCSGQNFTFGFHSK